MVTVMDMDIAMVVVIVDSTHVVLCYPRSNQSKFLHILHTSRRNLRFSVFSPKC
jgi:hypothetical protein